MPLQRFEEALNNVSNNYFGDTERLFTYELYYELRKVLNDNPLPYNNIVIDAELPKRRLTPHQAVVYGLLPLDRLMSPDFIIHERDTGTHQLLVSEVKAERSLSRVKTITDLNKLISLRRNYNFEIGVFVAINVSLERIRQHVNNVNTEIQWPIVNGVRNIDPTLNIHIFTKLNDISPWEHDTLIDIINNP